MKCTLLLLLLCFAGIGPAWASPLEPRKDSIIILFGKKTRIAIQTENKADLQALRNYDLNALLDRVIDIREKAGHNAGRDTSFVVNGDTVTVRQNQVEIRDRDRGEVTFSVRIGGADGGSGRDSTHRDHKPRKKRRTTSEWYVDLGLNNYLTGSGAFPDQNLAYSLRPLGSRYLAVSQVYKTRIGGPGSALHLTYGIEGSFYNFMFDGNSRIAKGAAQAEFIPVIGENQLPKALDKSKLTVIYASLPVMPMLEFGRSEKNGFRIGVGGFVGYRLHSYSKIKDDKGQKDHQRSNFYLNNVRYGVQALVGVRGVDLFFKYDLNPLFTAGNGPDLRAISFGFRF